VNRKKYLMAQKEKGRHLVGVFPAQFPREILWAMDVVTAEIWDPPVEVTSANAHLQPYICSVVRMGLELVLQGKCDFLDAFLFPHTCDSIQNMASVIHDYIGAQKPCYFFYHPKASTGTSARKFYRDQLKRLAQSMETQFGALDEDRLKQRIEQRLSITRLLTALYDMRAEGAMSAGNEEFYQTIRMGEYLFPDDWIPQLEAFLHGHKQEGKGDGIAVVLSGVLPNPPELLGLLDHLGVCVAHDDLLVGSRRLLIPPVQRDDPFEQLTESYFAMPPCSTTGSPIADRSNFLMSLVRKTGAKGVIFNVVKFCEPEWFDIPNLTEELRKEGIPSLVLDTEINQGLSGQLTTRVEAFTEMIR
jgi:benzoyl-CoA reductase/2-hydroxyglutaryl-CoA dehydratase subunit BcrC/BadD/HgdB